MRGERLNTVLVVPDEWVTVVARSNDFQGMDVYHGNNPVHEGMENMRNYLIEWAHY